MALPSLSTAAARPNLATDFFSRTVHRDLKPENLFLHLCDDQRLVIKLLDFGIARMTEGAGMPAAEARMTQDGAILGTPLFLTPEQALGETEKIGAGTDIWPIGLIAHELLTGSSYWSGEQMTTLLAKIIFKKLVPPSEKGVTLGSRFDDWFLRSCAREPTDRWPSVGAQVEALADALQVERALMNANEPPPALRAWLAARMARPGTKHPEVSLAILTDTARPSRPSTAIPQVSSEVVVMEAEPQRSMEVKPAPEPTRRRRILATILYSGIVTVVLVLGGLGLYLRMRGEPAVAPKPVTSDRTDIARLTPPAPKVVLAPPPVTPPSGPTTDPAETTDPIEAQDPAAKSRRGLRNKPSGSRPHGKKPRANDPSTFDPVAP